MRHRDRGYRGVNGAMLVPGVNVGAPSVRGFTLWCWLLGVVGVVGGVEQVGRKGDDGR